MIAYLYDNEKYYIGSTVLQESPLEPNVYFDQPNSTKIEPPECGEEEIAIWDGRSWGRVPDYSGKLYYSKIDKSKKRFNRGEAFDINYTDLEPPAEIYVIWQGKSWGVDTEKKSEYDKQQCKNIAKMKLSKSDWSVLQDVNISNKPDFINYRSQLRNLILNPVEEPIFPEEPQPVWSK